MSGGAVVTGAGRGLGRQIAEWLVERGYEVLVTDVDEEAAKGAAAELGGSTDGMAVDVRDEDIHGDYNVRNVASERVTRTAYTVGANAGIQLTLPDGRQFLIGSKQPQPFAAAVLAAWRAARPMPSGEIVA